MTRFSLGPVLALMALPSALGHMAVWGDYVYEQGTGDDIFNPLNSERSFDEWVRSHRIRLGTSIASINGTK